MAHSLKEETSVTREETGARGETPPGTPPEDICRKLPDGTLIQCPGEFVQHALAEDQDKKEREKEQDREMKKKEKELAVYSHPDSKPRLNPGRCGRYMYMYNRETEKLYRNFTSILNKLTPQLFTKLTDKALQLPIDTEERLKGVTKLTFEKAISEPIFSTGYAHMCQKLSTLTVQSSSNPGQIVQFRPILVHNCQQEFEKEKQSEIDEVQRKREISQLPANQQEAKLKLLQEQIIMAKRRTLGNIRFIGELYKLRILTENIMHNCIMKLLKAKDDDSLECLCILMSTIGKDLDHEKAKNRMDQYFDKFNKIIASQKNRPRIRFLMCDLIDLRKNNWVLRSQESKPTTIDALLREWHVTKSDYGWNMVSSTNKTRRAYDPAKRKLTRMTTADDNIQLVPGGRSFSTWCKARMNTAQTTPRQALTSQPPATGSDGQQRSAKNFRLVDPTTNKDVPERRMHDSSGSSSPHSGRSSANVTPPVGVEFTLDGASAADNSLNSVRSQGDWLHVFRRGLTSLLNERRNNNRIFDWIERNISDTQKQHSEFIRALVTIICQNTSEGEGQSYRIDPEILKLRCPVLERYIDNKRPLELQALYAVQALNHSLHSPPGLLRILFDVLYDEDVITEEAFYDWKKSDDPKESAGKGMALKCVISFFTWLAEAEAETD